MGANDAGTGTEAHSTSREDSGQRDVAALAATLEGLRRVVVDSAVEELTHRVPSVTGRGGQRLRLVHDLVDLQLAEGISRLRASLPDTQPAFSPLVEELESQLARDGVPVADALIALQVLQRVLVRQLLGLPEPDATVVRQHLPVITDTLSRVTEESSRAFVERYREATSLWNRSAGAGMSRRVSRVLDREVDDPAAAERLIGHPVSGLQAAGVTWAVEGSLDRDDLTAAYRALRRLRNVTSVLLLPVDENEVWWWTAVSETTDPSVWADQLSRAGPRRVRTALSSCAAGLASFRSAHRDALAAATVARAPSSASSPEVVLYRDVAPVALLARDPEAAADWVTATLGKLAEDTPAAARLRRTLLTHLRTGGDAQATSQALFIHRNTVGYRVGRAESLLPRPLASTRLDVALALEYHAWLGPAPGASENLAAP